MGTYSADTALINDHLSTIRIRVVRAQPLFSKATKTLYIIKTRV